MKTDQWDPGEERVVLVRPGGEHDITLLTTAGAIRFVEGRSIRAIPLSVAKELAGPGWQIEPLVVLQEGTYEGGTK